MNGFIILCAVFMGIFLYLWALTQSQCNNNAEKINKGLEAIRDALIAMERYADTLEARIKALEQRTVIGYESPVTWNETKQKKQDDSYNAPLCTRKIGVIRIDSGNMNDTNDKEPNIPGYETAGNPGNKPTPDHITIGEIADRYKETPDHKTHGDPMK